MIHFEKAKDNNERGLRMNEMTSRERVYNAVNHKESDRVPICFAGTSATVIQEGPPDACLGASALYNYLGITDSKPEVGPVGNIVYDIDERIIERLHSAGDKKLESIKITAELIKGLKNICDGVYIIPLGWESKIPEFLDAVNT